MQNKVVVAVAGYSISLIRDPERGTSQFYLRVAWTSALKQFKLLVAIMVIAFARCA